MPSMLPFSLPLQEHPPMGYGWEEGHDLRITAFSQAISQHDMVIGQRRCVVCGAAPFPELGRCHIVGQEIVS